jgi:hemolysin III
VTIQGAREGAIVLDTAHAPTQAPTPKLRGLLHAGMFPVAIGAGGVLVAVAPSAAAKVAAALYAASAAMLFGVSAAYHRALWSGRLQDVLRRFDHANIYLIIAGTYTPFAALALHGNIRLAVLTVIWAGAAAGLAFRMAWLRAPRWLYTSLYIGLGWTAVFVMPQLVRGAGLTAVILILAGGVLYSLGGVVYGLRKPDPLPRWFGFHEVFHALTVAAYIVQYVAVSLVVYHAG